MKSTFGLVSSMSDPAGSLRRHLAKTCVQARRHKTAHPPETAALLLENVLTVSLWMKSGRRTHFHITKPETAKTNCRRPTGPKPNKGSEMETSAFDLDSRISREPTGETEEQCRFLELVSNQRRIFLGRCRRTSAVSRRDRCQGRPSLKSRLQAEREYLLRLRASPRTQTGAAGENNYARPVCSPSAA